MLLKSITDGFNLLYKARTHLLIMDIDFTVPNNIYFIRQFLLLFMLLSVIFFTLPFLIRELL